jgi:hypothetical protein
MIEPTKKRSSPPGQWLHTEKHTRRSHPDDLSALESGGAWVDE